MRANIIHRTGWGARWEVISAQPCKQMWPESQRGWWDKHPLKAAKRGQITRGRGWVGVRKRSSEWGEGRFFYPPSLPIKAAASSRDFDCRTQLNICPGAENRIKLINTFLPALLDESYSEHKVASQWFNTASDSQAACGLIQGDGWGYWGCPK